MVDNNDEAKRRHSWHNNGGDCDFGEEEGIHSHEEEGVERLR